MQHCSAMSAGPLLMDLSHSEGLTTVNTKHTYRYGYRYSKLLPVAVSNCCAFGIVSTEIFTNKKLKVNMNKKSTKLVV
jgi:hypothetical protein